MTNRKISAARTRERLVEAAKEIICAKGLSNTSVDEITEKSGVSKGTFYTYFKRKEDIVFELSKGMFSEILENAKSYGDDFIAKLENYMVPELVEDEEQRGKLKSHIDAVQELLQYGKDNGLLKPDTPIQNIAYVITDLLYGQMLCWCLSSGAYSYAERTGQFCKAHLADLLKEYLI